MNYHYDQYFDASRRPRFYSYFEGFDLLSTPFFDSRIKSFIIPLYAEDIKSSGYQTIDVIGFQSNRFGLDSKAKDVIYRLNCNQIPSYVDVELGATKAAVEFVQANIDKPKEIKRHLGTQGMILREKINQRHRKTFINLGCFDGNIILVTIQIGKRKGVIVTNYNRDLIAKCYYRKISENDLTIRDFFSRLKSGQIQVNSAYIPYDPYLVRIFESSNIEFSISKIDAEKKSKRYRELDPLIQLDGRAELVALVLKNN